MTPEGDGDLRRFGGRLRRGARGRSRGGPVERSAEDIAVGESHHEPGE